MPLPQASLGQWLRSAPDSGNWDRRSDAVRPSLGSFRKMGCGPLRQKAGRNRSEAGGGIMVILDVACMEPGADGSCGWVVGDKRIVKEHGIGQD